MLYLEDPTPRARPKMSLRGVFVALAVEAAVLVILLGLLS